MSAAPEPAQQPPTLPAAIEPSPPASSVTAEATTGKDATDVPAKALRKQFCPGLIRRAGGKRQTSIMIRLSLAPGETPQSVMDQLAQRLPRGALRYESPNNQGSMIPLEATRQGIIALCASDKVPYIADNGSGTLSGSASG